MLSHTRLLALAMCGVAAGCSLVAPRFEKPTVTVAGIELVGGSFMQQNFAVKLNIDNPNDRVLPVTRVHVELRVAGDEVATGVNTRTFVVPAHGSTQFDMTVKANLALALLKLAGRQGSQADAIDYQVTGGATIDMPLVGELPFHQNGSFSLKALQ